MGGLRRSTLETTVEGIREGTHKDCPIVPRDCRVFSSVAQQPRGTEKVFGWIDQQCNSSKRIRALVSVQLKT